MDADSDDQLSSHSLDQLLGQKAALLRTKLNVLGAELRDRFRLREQNLSALADECERLDADMEQVSRLVRYDLREPRDLSPFVQQRAQLDQELRRQTTACWTDIVPVVRDFLGVWEALEQSRARSPSFTMRDQELRSVAGVSRRCSTLHGVTVAQRQPLRPIKCASLS